MKINATILNKLLEKLKENSTQISAPLDKIKQGFLLLSKLLFLASSCYYLYCYTEYAISINLIVQYIPFISIFINFIEKLGIFVLIFPMGLVSASFFYKNKFLDISAAMAAISGNLFTVFHTISTGMFEEKFKVGFLTVYHIISQEKKVEVFKTIFDHEIQQHKSLPTIPSPGDFQDYVQKTILKNWDIYVEKLKGLTINSVDNYAHKIVDNIYATYLKQISLASIPKESYLSSFWHNYQGLIVLGILTFAGVVYYYITSKMKEQAQLTEDLAKEHLELVKLGTESAKLHEKSFESMQNTANIADVHNKSLDSLLDQMQRQNLSMAEVKERLNTFSDLSDPTIRQNLTIFINRMLNEPATDPIHRERFNQISNVLIVMAEKAESFTQSVTNKIETMQQQIDANILNNMAQFVPPLVELPPPPLGELPPPAPVELPQSEMATLVARAAEDRVTKASLDFLKTFDHKEWLNSNKLLLKEQVETAVLSKTGNLKEELLQIIATSVKDRSIALTNRITASINERTTVDSSFKSWIESKHSEINDTVTKVNSQLLENSAVIKQLRETTAETLSQMATTYEAAIEKNISDVFIHIALVKDSLQQKITTLSLSLEEAQYNIDQNSKRLEELNQLYLSQETKIALLEQKALRASSSSFNPISPYTFGQRTMNTAIDMARSLNKNNANSN